MLKHRLASVIAFAFLASSLFAQGLETKATKDDWEEINFEFNSSILSDGYPSLLRLADLLKQHSDYRVKVEGHTDYVGSLAYNEKLALARANAVKSFLVKYGAGDAQISTSGQGKRTPSVPNTTKEGRFINRRVVMTVTDGTGKVIASGGVSEVVPALDERLKKLEDCCNAILKKLDKLDEILAAIRDLKAENDRLKADMANLRDQVSKPIEIPKPLTAEQVTDIARTALDEHDAKNPKFSIGTINLGPTTYGDLSVSGQGRFFGIFARRHAVQAQGEYMYYRGGDRVEGRQEGQFDIGLVNRFGRAQAGVFGSFKYVNLNRYQSGGWLGQGAFTLDYIFSRGRIGAFATHGFLDNAVVNRANLGPTSFTETYLKIVNQYGGSGAVALWGNSWIEGNIGLLRARADSRPGGMARFVQPFAQNVAFTVEAGLNETLLTAKNSGRVAFGLQFGNWLSPKDYGTMDTPVPVDVPRVRYEILERRVGNSAPVADAGPDVTVQAGVVQLNGTGSYDPDRDPLTYEWLQVGGPTVSLTNGNTATPSFTAAADQTYSFRLTVRDPGGLQATDRVTITVRQTATARILRFQAQPTVIDAGQSSTLIWQVENATSVEITNLGPVALSGSSSVSPTETTMYRLTARSAQGEVNEIVTVTVRRPDVRILRFLATPTTITPGEASTLSWETENAETVSISGIGNVARAGATTVSPTETTTYTITATGRFGSVTSTATVQVNQGGLPRIIRFTSTPVEVLPGEQAALVWQVEDATEVTISGIGPVELQGTSTVSPTQNTTYTITARNRNGQVTATTVLGVITPVKILDFVADPSVQTDGQPVTLRWSTTNATEVIITGVGPVQPNGSVVVRPTADTSYTLLAYGNRSQASAFVLVKIVAGPDTNRPPVAHAGFDQLLYRNSFSLDGTRSFDPDSDPITYSWRLVNFTPDPATKGPGPTDVTITGGTTARPVVNVKQWGSYVFELTVTDSKGASSTAFTRVTFEDP